jgi:CDP-diacylglycerol pyrophosphatase
MRSLYVFAAFAAAALAADGVRAADPDALWKIVHERCVPAVEAGSGTGPCAAVDLDRRIAVLKDMSGATQFLLIPTDRVPGIESDALLAPDAPNYWEAAWEARHLFIERAGKPVPRDDIGLAINSMRGRSQNQLHIHIDCVSPEVKQTLTAQASRIGNDWTAVDATLAKHRYRARRLDGQNLAVNPFMLLAQDGDAAAHMGDETLVVVGWEFADGNPGFILLADRADPATGDFGSGEELEDHACAVLK